MIQAWSANSARSTPSRRTTDSAARRKVSRPAGARTTPLAQGSSLDRREPHLAVGYPPSQAPPTLSARTYRRGKVVALSVALHTDAAAMRIKSASGRFRSSRPSTTGGPVRHMTADSRAYLFNNSTPP
jgi:hypothetical protein